MLRASAGCYCLLALVAVAPALCKQTVLLVRTPKTGSSTALQALDHRQQDCGYALTYIHDVGTPSMPWSDSPPSAHTLSRFDKVVLMVRDPVGRFISAFNYRRATQAHDGSAFEKELFNCFAHVRGLTDALARSRDRTKSAQRTYCENVAWRACEPSGLHMITAGVSWFVSGAGLPVFQRLMRSKSLEIIRTEAMEEDTTRVLRWLRCNPRLDKPLPRVNSMYPGKDDVEVSPEGAIALRQALARDYAAYHGLLAGQHLLPSPSVPSPPPPRLPLSPSPLLPPTSPPQVQPSPSQPPPPNPPPLQPPLKPPLWLPPLQVQPPPWLPPPTSPPPWTTTSSFSGGVAVGALGTICFCFLCCLAGFLGGIKVRAKKPHFPAQQLTETPADIELEIADGSEGTKKSKSKCQKTPSRVPKCVKYEKAGV